MIRKFLMFSTLLLCTAGIASAESFTFNYTGTSELGQPGTSTASGTFLTTAEGAGEYLITSIVGTFDGNPITLLSTNDIPYGTNDNLLYYPAQASYPGTDPSYVDYDGIAFTTSAGEFNLYYTLGNYALISESITNGTDLTGDLTISPAVSATPEPSSLLLLGTGLLGACFMLRRKIAA